MDPFDYVRQFSDGAKKYPKTGAEYRTQAIQGRAETLADRVSTKLEEEANYVREEQFAQGKEPTVESDEAGWMDLPEPDPAELAAVRAQYGTPRPVVGYVDPTETPSEAVKSAATRQATKDIDFYGIGADIPGTNNYRAGVGPAPKEVPLRSVMNPMPDPVVQGQFDVKMDAAIEREGEDEYPADPRKESYGVTTPTRYGVLSTPSTYEKVVSAPLALPYGAGVYVDDKASQIAADLLGKPRPERTNIGESPAAALGQTLAAIPLNIGRTKATDLPEVGNMWTGDSKATEDSWLGSAWKGVKNLPTELGELASLPLHMGVGIGNTINTAIDSSTDPDERGLKIAQGARDLGTGIIESYEKTLFDPPAAVEDGMIESALNMLPVAGAVGKFAAKTKAASAAKTAAALESAEEMAKGFRDGASVESAAQKAWEARRSANVKAQQDLLRKQQDAHATGDFDNTSSAYADEMKALIEERNQIRLSEPERGASGFGTKFDEPLKLKEVEIAQLQGKLPSDVLKQRRQAQLDSISKIDDAPDLLVKQSAANKGVDPWNNITQPFPQTSWAKTGELVEAQRRIKTLDKQISQRQTIELMEKIALGLPMAYATMGTSSALSGIQHATRRLLLDRPGNSVARFLLRTRTDLLPEAVQAIERERGMALREGEMVAQDLISAIPPGKRPTVREALHLDDATSRTTGEISPIEWSETTMGPDGQMGSWVPANFTLGNAPENLKAAAQAQVMLETANVYGLPLARQARQVIKEAQELGINLDNVSGQGPGWFNAFTQERLVGQSRKPTTPVLKDVYDPAGLAGNLKNRGNMLDTARARSTDLGVEVVEGLAGLRAKVEQVKGFNQIAADKTLALTPDEFNAKHAAASMVEGSSVVLNPSFKSSVSKAFRLVENEPQKWGKLAGKYVNEDVLVSLRNGMQALEGAQTWYSKTLNTTKKMLTAWNPGTWGRNTITSALIMAPAVGMELWAAKNLPFYARAMKDIAAGTKTAAYREAVGSGVFNAGMSAELGGTGYRVNTRYRPDMDPMQGAIAKKAASILDRHFSGAFSHPVAAMQALMELANDVTSSPAARKAAAVELDRLAPTSVPKITGGPGGFKLTLNEGPGIKANEKALRNRNVLEKATRVSAAAGEITNIPGAFYGVQDNLFRLAYFYKLRAGGMPVAEAAAAARKAFIDYENVPGVVQLLRTPHALVDANGKKYGGTAIIPFIVAQPFVAYPARAIPLYAEWAKKNPAKAAALAPLLTYFTGMNAAHHGMTADEAEVLGVVGREGRPNVVITGRAEDGSLTTIDPSTLNPAGSYEMRTDPNTGKVEDTLDYLARQGVGQNLLLSPIFDLVKNQDSFTGKKIVTGSDTPTQLGEAATYLGQRLLPTVTPSLGVSPGQGFQFKGGRLVERYERAAAGEPNAQGLVEDPDRVLMEFAGGLRPGKLRVDDAVLGSMLSLERKTTGDSGSIETSILKSYGLPSKASMTDNQKDAFNEVYAGQVRPLLEGLLSRLKSLPDDPLSDPEGLRERALRDVEKVLNYDQPRAFTKRADMMLGKYRGVFGDRVKEIKERRSQLTEDARTKTGQ